MDDAALIVVGLRLLLPLIILRFPLVGVLLCAALDVADYRYLGSYEWYQFGDKLFDLYYLGFAAIIVMQWKDRVAKFIALGAYFYRVIGVAAVFLLDQRWLFFVFPNFFELFFIFYLLFVYLSKTTHLTISKGVIAMVIASLLVPKLVQEYVLHIYQPQLGAAPLWVTDIITQFAWLAAPLYILPALLVMVYLLLRLRQQRVATAPKVA